MSPALLHPFHSTKEIFSNLKPQQKYGIVAIGVCAVSIITGSYYWSLQKQKAWKKLQKPILAKYWSDSYNEARNKFRESCAKIPNCKTHSIREHPMEDLTMDLCYVPCIKKSKQKPSHLVIHISGTHGVESYAGAAIQNKLLQNIANSNSESRDYDILFIHSLNAFGMCHSRRFNRYNVDLNRNTILNKHKWREIKRRDPNLHGYDSISYLINPEYKTKYPWPDIAIWWGIMKILLRFGNRDNAENAIVCGQYHQATGLYYGGFRLQNEQKKLFNFLVNECKTIWNVDLLGLLEGKNSKLTVIDVHTGVGPKGVDSLFAGNKADIEKAKQVQGFPAEYLNDKQRLRSGEKGRQRTERRDVSVGSVGRVNVGITKLFKNVDRFMDDGYESDRDCDKELDDRLDCITLTEEFGTVSPLFVIHALIMENAIYNLQLMDADCKNVLKFRQEKLRNVFFLHDDIQWKYDVLRRGVALFNCLSNR